VGGRSGFLALHYQLRKKNSQKVQKKGDPTFFFLESAAGEEFDETGHRRYLGPTL
jgi:hypothetical protein